MSYPLGESFFAKRSMINFRGLRTSFSGCKSVVPTADTEESNYVLSA